MRKIIQIRPAAAVLALSLLLSGCAGGGTTASTDSGRTPVDEGRRPIANASGTEAPDPVSSGGTANISQGTAASRQPTSTGQPNPSRTPTANGSSAAAVNSSKPDPSANYTVIKAFQPNKTQSSDRITYETPSLNLASKGRGFVRITVKNTSAATKLTVYFTTKDDPNYTLQKSTDVSIDFGSSASKQYVADLSALYGFTGTIDKLRIVTGSIHDGSLALEKVEVLEGGGLVAPFSLSGKTVSADRASLKKKAPSGKSLFPDGIMSALSNGDGTYHFFSSNPLTGLNTIGIFKGTLDNPLQTLVQEAGSVQGAPTGYGMEQYNYVSIGQVYRFSGSECFTIIHLERHFDDTMGWDGSGNRTHKNNTYFAGSLALGYSPDNGMTWYYAGEVATHACESVHRYYGFGKQLPSSISQVAYSRDIGNGPFIVKDGYVYVYFIDTDTRLAISMAVMRAPLNDVIRAARAKSTARQGNLFKKYYNGGFTESAIAGKSSDIVDGACPANFMTIIYSTYLKKYVLARCSAPCYGTNDGDIVMNISADPTDFRGNNYYIDASLRGSQYPTLFAPSGNNPSFETGKSVYLYYIDAPRDDRFLWDKADVVRRQITFD